MVKQPFSSRVNTKDNTPAIIYTDIVPGDKLKIIAIPKGGGAENMSRLVMLTPAAGRQGLSTVCLKQWMRQAAIRVPRLSLVLGLRHSREDINARKESFTQKSW